MKYQSSVICIKTFAHDHSMDLCLGMKAVKIEEVPTGA